MKAWKLENAKAHVQDAEPGVYSDIVRVRPASAEGEWWQDKDAEYLAEVMCKLAGDSWGELPGTFNISIQWFPG